MSKTNTPLGWSTEFLSHNYCYYGYSMFTTVWCSVHPVNGRQKALYRPYSEQDREQDLIYCQLPFSLKAGWSETQHIRTCSWTCLVVLEISPTAAFSDPETFTNTCIHKWFGDTLWLQMHSAAVLQLVLHYSSKGVSIQTDVEFVIKQNDVSCIWWTI